MNPTVKKVVQYATVAGAATLILGSAAKLLSVKGPKEAIMPVVSVLVGVAAFNYAIKSSTITVDKKAS